MVVADAREVAFVTLLRRGLATRALDAVAPDFGLAGADRALAHELVSGVERRRGTLDAVIAAYVESRGLERDLRTALRLGLYQMLFLDRIPPHAAVHETVRLVRERRGARSAGFVNAVLRNVLRGLEVGRGEGVVDRDRRTLEVGPRRLRFGKDIFPDPEGETVDHFAAVYSHPRFLVARWMECFGRDRARQAFEAGNEIPSVTLRVNPLRTTREALRAALGARGFAVSPGAHPLSLRAGSDPRGLFETPEFREGHFTAQDETAMGVVDLLAPSRGERVLDLCAAPGGKATQIAEAMGDEGEVVAADVSEERLGRIRENAARLGLRSIRPLLLPRRPGAAPEGKFDRVLVDAPCSNTGVLARRPEARWRVTPAALGELARIQAAILGAGLRGLRRGGRLVYSTCSLEPEENGDLVRRILTRRKGLRLLEERSRLPGDGADGGYAAAIEDEGTPSKRLL